MVKDLTEHKGTSAVLAGPTQPEYVHDYPNGAGRFVQQARGYAWTLVNGEVFMADGEHTGALAGATLRS